MNWKDITQSDLEQRRQKTEALRQTRLNIVPAPKPKKKQISGTNKTHDYLWFIFKNSKPLNAESAAAAFARTRGDGSYEKDSVAPVITRWKKLGILRQFGKLPTLHGRPSSAFVFSDNALQLFVEHYGREPTVLQ